MALSYKEMQHTLMAELRLYHFPIAVKFFLDQTEVDTFKKEHEFYTPVNSTLSHYPSKACRLYAESIEAFL